MGLAVDLKVRLPGFSAADISSIMEAAHEMCPYSKAVKDSINVKLQPLTEQDTG